MARPLPERTNNGVRLLLPRSSGSTLALGQDLAPKRHGYVRPVVPDLLEDCPYSIVRGLDYPQVGGGCHDLQGPPMQLVTTDTHLGVIQAANPEDATLPPKLQSHLAHLPRYASPTTKVLSLSHQSLAYYLTGVLNASIGFQALHLTHPTTALQPATRAVTKAWAAHWGWPTSIPTRTIRAAWPHNGDAGGDEVKAAYTRHTALLLHRMTHNHSPEVREVTAIRPQAAQRARNTCPRWVFHQTGMPTNMNTRL